MTISLLLIILKYSGTVISGLYGMYATLTDFYEERDGHRRLTKKGYFGITLLCVSLFLSLSMDIVSDIKEGEEAAKRRAKEEALVKQLSQQVVTTNKILSENLERIENFEIKLFVSINPLAFKYANGQSILSQKTLAILEADKRGEQELDVKYFDLVVKELRDNYDLVRKQLFQEWEFSIQINHEKQDDDRFFHDVWVRRQMEDDLSSFVISHVSGEVEGVTGVQCWLVYRLPPNRAAGFRTFRDFNGAKMNIEIEGSPSIMELTTIRFHLGAGGGRKPLFIQNQEFSEAKRGLWRADKTIPIDYF